MTDRDRDRPAVSRDLDDAEALPLHGGPELPRDGDKVRAEERLANNPNAQASYQATPETMHSPIADRDQTGTARRAEHAAGRDPDESNRAEAREAFRDSRGDHRPRDGR